MSVSRTCIYIYIVVCVGSSGRTNRKSQQTKESKTRGVNRSVHTYGANKNKKRDFENNKANGRDDGTDRRISRPFVCQIQDMHGETVNANGINLNQIYGCSCAVRSGINIARLRVFPNLFKPCSVTYRPSSCCTSSDGLRALCIEPINLHGRRCSLAEVCLLHAVRARTR